MSIPPYHWWRTVFVLIPLITGATIVLGATSLASGLFSGSGHFAHRCAQWWSRFILATTGVSVERRGAALPPPGTSCVFVANHASFYDIPILFTSVPLQLRILAKASLGRVPFIGWHLQRSGHLLVDPARSGPATFRKMKRMVHHGASLIVFPEGARTLDGHVHDFKRGGFLLAIQGGLPIVPVSVAHSQTVMPRGRLMVCPAAVVVTVHEPVSTAGLTREDARALADSVRETIAGALDAPLAAPEPSAAGAGRRPRLPT